MEPVDISIHVEDLVILRTGVDTFEVSLNGDPIPGCEEPMLVGDTLTCQIPVTRINDRILQTVKRSG